MSLWFWHRELVIKPKFERAGLQLFGVVDTFVRPVPEVPFADHGGRVAVLFEQ
jgi:hypothetical protein